MTTGSRRMVQGGFLTFIIAAVTTGLIWGSGGPAVKWLYVGSGVPGIDAMSLVFARSAWALPVLGAVAAITWPRNGLGRDLLPLLGLGVITAVMNTLFPIAAQHTSAANLTLIYGATAPVVALFEGVFRGVVLDNRRKLAVAFGLLGVTVVALTKSTSGASLLGNGILAVWLIGFGGMSVLTRSLCSRLSAYFVVAFSFATGSAILIVLGLPFGLQRGLWETLATPGTTFAFVGVLVLGMTFIAPTGFAVAAKEASAALATGVTYYLAIAVGLVLSVTVLHEQIKAGGIAGALLLFAGIGLMIMPSRERLRPPIAENSRRALHPDL